MSKFRLMMMSTAALGMAGVAMSTASAGEVEKSASFSGHVNRVVGVVDNGDNTTISAKDNGTSASRFRFDASAKSEDMTISARTELGASGSGNTDANAESSESVSLRHSYVSINNSAGTLTIGHTSGAADAGVGQNSKSSAAWYGTMNYSGSPVSSGGFVTTTAAAAANGGAEETGIASVTGYLAGTSTGRNNVIKYSSPDMNGFDFSASIGGGATGSANEQAEFFASYGADFDGTAVDIQGAYAATAGNSTTNKDAWHVSLAGELASGLNAAIGYGEISKKATATNDVEIFFAELGYDMTDVSDLGGTGINIQYMDQDYSKTNTSEYQVIGVNVSQSLADYGTTVYGGVSQQSYSVTGTTYEDINSGWVGIKVVF